MKHDWMQWIPCSLVKFIPIECSGFYAAWLNVVVYMQPGKMHPTSLLRIPCSMIEWSGFHAAWRNGTLLNAGDFMQHDWMQCIPSAWLNAVDFLKLGPKHHDLMQWIFCSMSQNIPIECSRYSAAWLNAVDFMQHGQKHGDWMQWIPCSMIECSVFYAAWPKASR